MYNSMGGFEAEKESCPFPWKPLSEQEIDAFDEHLRSLVKQSDADSFAVIPFPKQLELDEGADELLMWFKQTSQLPGPGGVRDSKCALICTQ
jgi:hypothetical protein